MSLNLSLFRSFLDNFDRNLKNCMIFEFCNETWVKLNQNSAKLNCIFFFVELVSKNLVRNAKSLTIENIYCNFQKYLKVKLLKSFDIFEFQKVQQILIFFYFSLEKFSSWNYFEYDGNFHFQSEKFFYFWIKNQNFFLIWCDRNKKISLEKTFNFYFVQWKFVFDIYFFERTLISDWKFIFFKKNMTMINSFPIIERKSHFEKWSLNKF